MPPPELIAQQPLPDRTNARLLVVDRTTESIRHAHVRDLPDFFQKGDAFVLNDTKVLPARLVGKRARTGGNWEGLFLGFLEPSENSGRTLWRIIFKMRGKPQIGETISLLTPDGGVGFPLELIAPLGDGEWSVRPLSDEPAYEWLSKVGWIPLPPYIRGGVMNGEDKAAYQTVYADSPGAVAAPTAGLHFTQELLDESRNRGIRIVPLTLHVGIGTFRPVSVDDIEQHVMHREFASISEESVGKILEIKRSGGRIIAIGTTSVRVLESAAKDSTLRPFAGETDLFIRPPYQFKVVDALLTNFHFPKSTLLILVRTFGGDELIRRAYEEAVREKYRLFSYGDAMLIL